MSIGEKLKIARTERNFTQEEVAEKINVSRQTVSNWENEKSLPDISSIIKLSDIYNLSLDELLKGNKEILRKIENDTSLVKSRKRALIFGFVLMIVSVILSMTNFIVTQPVIDFISSALPWILCGLGAAIVCAYSGLSQKKIQNKRNDNYAS